MVAASFVALGALAGVCGVLYREIVKSHHRETEMAARVLPLVQELLAFLARKR